MADETEEEGVLSEAQRRFLASEFDLDGLKTRVLRDVTFDIDELLGDARCPVWLREEAKFLMGSPCITDRVSAVGLIGRLLARSPEHGSRQLFDRVCAWARKLSEETRQDIEELMVTDTMQLSNHIRMVVGNRFCDSIRVTVANSCIHQRDKAESIRFALALIDRGQGLSWGLKTCDGYATKGQSCFSGAQTDELLKAVAKHEPNAWWVAHITK